VLQALYVNGSVVDALEFVLDGPPRLFELRNTRLVAAYLQLPLQVEVEEPFFLGLVFGEFPEPAFLVTVGPAGSARRGPL
jgi:hypothetical protein